MGGDTFKTPFQPPYEQLLPLPTPCFKMCLERSLNDPHLPPPYFKHFSLLPPSPSTPPQKKNFDHTPKNEQIYHPIFFWYVEMSSSGDINQMPYHLTAFELTNQLLYTNLPSLERKIFPKDQKSTLPSSVAL